MKKLKLISQGMLILGLILLISGFAISMKELMEYGIYIGVAGLIGYAIMFISSSTSVVDNNSISD